MAQKLCSWERSLRVTLYIVPPNSPAKMDTLTLATLSHPTVQLRDTLYLRLHCHTQHSRKRGASFVPPNVPAHSPTKQHTLTQATLPHSTVQLRVYSNSGRIVQPNSPAKGYTLSRATLSQPTVKPRNTL